MGKKKIYVIFALLTAIALCMTLVACNQTVDEPQPYTVEINTADDLKNVALGYGATKAVYELRADLDLGTDWTPVGSSVTDSFRGEFRGNGHTITYTVNVPEPEERDLSAKLADESNYGLFGVAYDATFKDVTVYATVTVPAMAESVNVGGLIGHAYGNISLNNVTVNGSVETTLGDIRPVIIRDDGSEGREIYYEDMNAHVGGVVGCVTGVLTADGVRASANVTVGAYTGCLVDYVFAGGLFGTVRTEDISKTSDDGHSVTNVSYKGNMDVSGAKVSMGGVFGSVYRASLKGADVKSNKMRGYVYQRIDVGGVAGFTDKTTLENAKTDIESIGALGDGVRGTRYRSFNVGGIVGYSSNGSSVKNVYADTAKVTVPEKVDNYVGGIVGMAHFTAIDSAYACGELYYDNRPVSEMFIKYTENDVDRSFYVYSGGAVGKLYGCSSVKNVATEFKAYQGLIGTAYNSVEIVTVNVTEGETIEAKLAEMGYTALDTQATATGKVDEKEGTKEYRLVHKYDATSTALYYDEANSKCIIDGAEAVGYLQNYGSSNPAEIQTVKNAVLGALE